MLRLCNTKIQFYFSSFNCWKCKKDNEQSELECNKCGYLLHPDFSIKKMNFYTLFRIPMKYKIDNKMIQNKSKDLQRRYHPDNFSVRKDNQLQIYATQYSSYVNAAKQTLLNDYKRAAYLLQVKGIIIAQDQESKISPLFLMQIFQMQEKIDETCHKQILQEYHHQAKRQIESIKLKFSELYEKEKLQEAKEVLIKFKYFDRICQTIQTKMQKCRCHQEHSC